MGRQSSIDRLPRRVRKFLLSCIGDSSITQGDATLRANELLEEVGSELRVSRAAVCRFYQRMKAKGYEPALLDEVDSNWSDEKLHRALLAETRKSNRLMRENNRLLKELADHFITGTNT